MIDISFIHFKRWIFFLRKKMDFYTLRAQVFFYLFLSEKKYF